MSITLLYRTPLEEGYELVGKEVNIGFGARGSELCEQLILHDFAPCRRGSKSPNECILEGNRRTDGVLENGKTYFVRPKASNGDPRMRFKYYWKAFKIRLDNLKLGNCPEEGIVRDNSEIAAG